jgi:hypothetical protein
MPTPRHGPPAQLTTSAQEAARSSSSLLVQSTQATRRNPSPSSEPPSAEAPFRVWTLTRLILLHRVHLSPHDGHGDVGTSLIHHLRLILVVILLLLRCIMSLPVGLLPVGLLWSAVALCLMGGRVIPLCVSHRALHTSARFARPRVRCSRGEVKAHSPALSLVCSLAVSTRVAHTSRAVRTPRAGAQVDSQEAPRTP